MENDNNPGTLESPLLRPGEAAALMGITTKTLASIADAGHLTVVTLPSGHRRYWASEVRALVLARPA